MTRELNPDHEAVAQAALERIKALGGMALDPNHIPGEPVDEGPEAKS